MNVPIRLAAEKLFVLKLMPRRLGIGRIAWIDVVAHQGAATIKVSESDPKSDPIEEVVCADTREGHEKPNHLWFAVKADIGRDATTRIEITAKAEGFQGRYSIDAKFAGLAEQADHESIAFSGE